LWSIKFSHQVIKSIESMWWIEYPFGNITYWKRIFYFYRKLSKPLSQVLFQVIPENKMEIILEDRVGLDSCISRLISWEDYCIYIERTQDHLKCTQSSIWNRRKSLRNTREQASHTVNKKRRRSRSNYNPLWENTFHMCEEDYCSLL